jgi:hypothetical protein
MERPHVPLTDAQVADVIDQVTSIGGYLVTDVCDVCRESWLLAIPATAPRAIPTYFGSRKTPPTYAIVCIGCDEAFKIPKLTT